jgi:hypothetical protein
MAAGVVDALQMLHGHGPELGGGFKLVFDTVTVTVVLVAELPAASRATAVSVCVPLATVVVFQVTEYGLAVSSAPRLAPSSLNCTPATPTLSDAVADTVTDAPDTVAPPDGAVIEIVGGVVSELAVAVAVKSAAPDSPRARWNVRFRRRHRVARPWTAWPYRWRRPSAREAKRSRVGRLRHRGRAAQRDGDPILPHRRSSAHGR